MKRLMLAMLMIAVLCANAHAREMKLRVSVTPSPPKLSSTVTLEEPSGNKMLDAGETGKLVVTVGNTGKGDAFDVVIKLSTDKPVKGLVYDALNRIGTVPSGKRLRARIPVMASEALGADSITFEVVVAEANGFDADPVRISFETKSFELPNLVVADMAIDDQNGNSMVEPLENVEVTLRVQNTGQGVARKTMAEVVKGKNVFIGGNGRIRFNLGDLGPGQYKDLSFIFYTNKRIGTGQPIPLDLRLRDGGGKFQSTQPLGLAMNNVQRNVREVVVRGDKGSGGPIVPASGLTVDIEKNLPRTKLSNPDAVAVVIGNTNYEKTRNVDFAISDAETIRKYLVNVLGYKDGNIIFKADASKGDFELFFGNQDRYEGRLYDIVKPGRSDVFVYYSGHGAPGLKSKKGYFVPVEADPQYIELGGYPAEVLYSNLSKIPARSITVVLDACFSGAAVFENISPMVIKIDNPMVNMKNVVVLSSSQGSQVSSWYNEKRHGMFTYFFLKAIHDMNADYNGDRKLTFDEIFRFVSDNADGVPYYARRIHGVKQTPTIEGEYKDKVLLRY